MKLGIASLVAEAVLLADLPTMCLSTATDGGDDVLRTLRAMESAATAHEHSRLLIEDHEYELTRECRVLARETMYDDFHAEHSFDCELHPDDADGRHDVVVAIEDGEALLAGRGIESGVTTIFAANSRILNGKLTLGEDILVGSKADSAADDHGLFTRRRRLSTTGDKTLLVVMVSTIDGKSPRHSPERMSDSLFGNGGDAVSLKSQYARCSNDQLRFEPYTGNGVANGVIQVRVSRTSADDDFWIKQAAQGEAWGVIRARPTDVADHVMYCMPDEVDMGLGYANINGQISVLRDDWCTYNSLQMHELGHNLGLDHSGEGGSEYGDETGVMGNSFEEDDSYMCFNNAKNWKLGWFTDRQINIDAGQVDYWSGELVGVVDYAGSSADQYVVLKVTTDFLDHDFYVGYNKRSGFNSDTKEAGNKVTVQTREREPDSKSWLVADLSEGESYSVDGAFSITVDDINSGGAQVTVLRAGAGRLCDPMMDLIAGDEVCTNTPAVCEATANLGENGKEPCDAWCERSGLVCTQAWNDGSDDCQKTSSISCGKSGNSWSICRCERGGQPPPPTPNPPLTPLPTRNPTKRPTRRPTRRPTDRPTAPNTALCTPMLDLIAGGDEVCESTESVCEATANLGANGRESCNDWCERSGLECTQAWDDGADDCQKRDSISCGETGNSYSICRCEAPEPQGLCEPYLARIWDNEVCSNTPEECEATADLAQNGSESCGEWCERYGLQCTQAWNDGDFCERTSEISCSTYGKSRSICLCEP